MLKMKRLASLATFGLLGSLIGTASADVVTDWNEITMSTVSVQRPGPTGMLDVALVHVAMHDAVQSIEKRYEPYNVEIKGAKGSRTAAATAAAYGVLAAITVDPTLKANLDAAYFDYLAKHGLSGDPGIQVGTAVAERILPLRRANPANPEEFRGGNEIGMWRPTVSYLPGPPASEAPMHAPWLARFDPFTLTGPARFRADPPPALRSERYRKDYDEVKAVGSRNSKVRTRQQTDLAHFYNDNFFTQWNRVLRTVAKRYIRDTGDSARLFALANMAASDALITCWDSKMTYVFWRPVTAIQNGNYDGNPKTVGDANWQPLANTPNYPDYTSGANSVVAAMTRTMERYFGTDRKTFEVTTLSDPATTKTRVYRRFSEAADDVVNARIYLGFHFRFADTAARTQGEKVADWAFDHFLLPKARKVQK